jgi:hypothetical protein
VLHYVQRLEIWALINYVIYDPYADVNKKGPHNVTIFYSVTLFWAGEQGNLGVHITEETEKEHDSACQYIYHNKLSSNHPLMGEQGSQRG